MASGKCKRRYSYILCAVKCHKGESGAYTTHIYLYDKAGKLAPLKGVNVTVPSAVVTPPTPSSSLSIGDVSVTELSASGYRVTAKINAPSGVSKVLMQHGQTQMDRMI